jgi:predicted ArsR family transcriptional regulator
MRGRLAHITQATPQLARPGHRPAPPSPAVQVPLDIPQADGQALLAMLARPDGVTAKEAGNALGKSKSRAGDYLRTLAARGIAVRTGSSRASRYRLARQAASPPQPEPAPARPDGYVTIAALADAVHDGLVDVDDDTRAVLEQARQLRDQAARRPHLTVVSDPESDAS